VNEIRFIRQLKVWIKHYNEYDSCFIDDTSSKNTSSKNTSCHVIQLPWLLCLCQRTHRCLAHAPAPMSTLVLLFAWLATISWDMLFPAVWLAGRWSHAGRVCLSEATCAIEQRKPCSRDHIVLYPFKWTNRLSHPLWRHQPTNLPYKEVWD